MFTVFLHPEHEKEKEMRPCAINSASCSINFYYFMNKLCVLLFNKFITRPLPQIYWAGTNCRASLHLEISLLFSN